MAGQNATSFGALDEALAALDGKRAAWAAASVPELIGLLVAARDGMGSVAEEWATRSIQAKGNDVGAAVEAQEYLGGPYAILRNINLLMVSLEHIAKHGRPQAPGSPMLGANQQVRVPVFPTDLSDRLLLLGIRGEIWLDKTVTLANLGSHMGSAYQQPPSTGICLVLGGGNVSSIGPMDCLYKLIKERKRCILKLHPVNAYLGDLIQTAFRGFIDAGYLRVIYGDVAEGQYLCGHRLVEEIHITGSDRTHDLIVFGSDVEGQKAKRQPLLNKPITSELGNVSPLIVVPGVWSESDLAYHAVNVVSSLANNSGFNCNATRVVITQRSWPQRERFLALIREQLGKLPPRTAYYPGARDRFERFHKEHPEAKPIGTPKEGQLPWLFVSDLDAHQNNDICFRTEAFCSVFSEVPLDSSSLHEFLTEATAFANETLWGTLNATILVHPKQLKDEADRAAFDRMLVDLRYGSVVINQWAGLGYALGCTSWGAFPGHDIYDIRSGLDEVHNTYLFDHVEKSVVWAPFRQFPVPLYFVNNPAAGKVAKSLTRFEASRRFLDFVKVLLRAVGL